MSGASYTTFAMYTTVVSRKSACHGNTSHPKRGFKSRWTIAMCVGLALPPQPLPPLIGRVAWPRGALMHLPMARARACVRMRANVCAVRNGVRAFKKSSLMKETSQRLGMRLALRSDASAAVQTHQRLRLEVSRGFRQRSEALSKGAPTAISWRFSASSTPIDFRQLLWSAACSSGADRHVSVPYQSKTAVPGFATGAPFTPHFSTPAALPCPCRSPNRQMYRRSSSSPHAERGPEKRESSSALWQSTT
jgi:hypothetical protein